MRKLLAAALLAAAFVPTKAQALENEELLALVAMPLAVAAVSEVTDVPMNELMDVVTLMNDALVPPAQFIEVVRYAPAALVVEVQPQPTFVEFVHLQYDNGLRGTALVNSIEDHFQVYDIHGVDLDVTAPRIVDVDARFLPAIVQTRIAEAKRHPHGGPPGQVKKQLGVQTGAEVVHGSKPGRRNDSVVTRVVENPPAKVTRERKVKKPDDDDRKPVMQKQRGRGADDGIARGNSGKGRGNSGGNKGDGQGKGKGKGKG
ncbi:MAG TPA: hypothetical protein VEU30_15425 [Thermoanaerobaculia bacterium]|nr:hypothetical protein [Thermoanaerobaculia bacterium]